MSTILLLVAQKENRRLILEWLKAHYQVLVPDPDAEPGEELPAEPFDLCIVDGLALNYYWQQLRTRREREKPVLLPILFITSRQGIKLKTRQLWQIADQLLVSPIEKQELQAQVEVLLRSRRLSLQLKLNPGAAEEFDTVRESQAVALLQLEADLTKALDLQQFHVYYQPIVSLYSGRIVGFEALVRWSHPKRGFITPDVFIPVAEATGLIVQIDLWVLREASRQTRIWQTALSGTSDLKISVNFSSQHFSRVGLSEKIEQVLKEVNLEAESLKLEITERSLLKDMDINNVTFEQIKSLGVELLLDDFGTGYSSLSYLHNLPIDALKIDRSFVMRIGSIDANSEEIIHSILQLSQNLEMYTIAEGVETSEQLAHLREWGCEYGQGYFFARPLDSATAWELIAAKPHW